MKEQPGTMNEAQRIGNYDIIRRIDIGGMGEVYLAEQRTAFNREVALKIIRSDLRYDNVARERFLREARMTAHIRYEHILSMIEFGTDEQDRLYYVTPYISGGTLAQRLQRGPLSLGEVFELFTALVQAVAYIHSRDVIHRDLKPSNVLLDDAVTPGKVYVRLIDFGIAFKRGMAASPPLTLSGTEMGTAIYMAPERFSGVAAPSNDIYSLGIILYQMLTGMLPSEEQRAHVPQPLEYIIQRCIAPRLEERFATAEDVLTAFEYAHQYLTTAPQNTSAKVPVVDVGAESVVRSSIPRPQEFVKQEVKALSRAEQIALPPLPRSPSGFLREDYEAPTSAIERPKSLPPLPPPEKLPRRRNQRRKLVFAIIPTSIVVVLLLIAGMLYFGVQSANSATITFSTQVHTVKQVFPITARPLQRNIEVANQSIPARVLTASQTGSQQGPTTGQIDCGFLGFGCKQAVAPVDVQTLDIQLKQTLEPEINTALKQQLQGVKGATQVGNVYYRTLNETPNPPVGSVSKTVTVTLVEQGSIEYYTTGDAQSLARQLLTKQTQQLDAHYVLVNSTIQIGLPAAQSVDGNGVVTLTIAAAGVAVYQFPQSQITSLQDQLKGLKVNAARSLMKQQPGVDASSVVVSVKLGDTLPGDTDHIKLILVNPSNLPSVQLPAVATPTASPTGTPNT